MGPTLDDYLVPVLNMDIIQTNIYRDKSMQNDAIYRSNDINLLYVCYPLGCYTHILLHCIVIQHTKRCCIILSWRIHSAFCLLSTSMYIQISIHTIQYNIMTLSAMYCRINKTYYDEIQCLSSRFEFCMVLRSYQFVSSQMILLFVLLYTHIARYTGN